MAAANTIKSFGNTRWRTDDIFSIPGGGSKGDGLSEKELKIMRQDYPLWSKNPSPLVNPVLGNQLRINPGNLREQLMAKTPYDSLSSWQKDIIMNKYNAAARSGPKSLEKEGIRIQTMYPGFRLP